MTTETETVPIELVTQLKAAGERARTARRKVEEANRDRDALVREAVAEGVPQADVARIVGVGKARVGQIVKAAS